MSSSGGLLSSAWDYYNSESTFLPLYVPLSIWIGAYVSCNVLHSKGTPFHKFEFIHNLHNYGAIILGWISLYFHNDDILNERTCILWSLGYFMVDCVDCVVRIDGPFVIHGVLSLSLGFANYLTPLCRTLRTNSRAVQCELSSPLLYVAKKTREPLHFAAFALMFTLCRIVYIPLFLIFPFHEGGMPYSDPRMLALIAFYGLNCFWYYKILRILIKGLLGKSDENVDKNTRKKED